MPVSLSNKVRVIMHLPAGYTKVLVEWTFGLGMADGGIDWDIPTEVIPLHLRAMGSRFLLLTTSLTGKLEAETMTDEQIRATIHQYSVREIEDE
jgi:hypothetical protein